MCITVGVVALVLVLERGGRAADGLRSPPRPRASGSTSFLAGAARLARAAQRLIDAGRVTVDGARAAEAPPRRGGRAGRGRAGAGGRGAAAAAASVPFAIAYEDEHLLVVDKPAGVVVHPARGHREGTLAQALAGRARRRRGPGARRDRPPPRPRHLRAARRRALRGGPPRAAGGAPQRASCGASTSRSSRAARRRAAGTIDAPIGRDRARAHAHVDRRPTTPREARTHFELERALRRLRAAARAPGDRPHAPDPRAPAGDRPPGRGRPGVRHAGRARASSASSCTPRAWPSRTRSRARRSTSARRCRPTCARRSAAAPEAAILTRQLTILDPCRVGGSRPCPGAMRRRRVRDAVRRGNLAPHITREQHRGSRSASRSCWRPASTSATRRAAGTRRCAASSIGERGGIYIIDLLQDARRCSQQAQRVRLRRSPTAAAPCCSSAPRSRRATRSRRSPRRPACRTSTTAGSAAC